MDATANHVQAGNIRVLCVFIRHRAIAPRCCADAVIAGVAPLIADRLAANAEWAGALRIKFVYSQDYTL